MSEQDPVASETIAKGVSSGLNRERVRVTDARLLIIFVFVALAIAYFAWRADENSNTAKHAVRVAVAAQQKAAAEQAKAEAAAIANCNVINAGNAKVNAILHQLAINATNSTGLNPTDKAKALETYSQLQLPIAPCSGLAGK